MAKNIHIHVDGGSSNTKDAISPKSQEIENLWKAMKKMDKDGVIRQFGSRLSKGHLASEAKSDLMNTIINQRYSRRDIDKWVEETSGKSKDGATKDAIPEKTEAEILKKIREGEWEAMSDVVKGRHVEIRNTANNKRFTVKVKDAQYTTAEYSRSADEAQKASDKANASGKPEDHRAAFEACKNATKMANGIGEPRSATLWSQKANKHWTASKEKAGDDQPTMTTGVRDGDWSAKHVGNFRFEVTTPEGKKITIGRAENSAEAIAKAKKLPAGASHDAIAEEGKKHLQYLLANRASMSEAKRILSKGASGNTLKELVEEYRKMGEGKSWWKDSAKYQADSRVWLRDGRNGIVSAFKDGRYCVKFEDRGDAAYSHWVDEAEIDHEERTQAKDVMLSTILREAGVARREGWPEDKFKQYLQRVLKVDPSSSDWEAGLTEFRKQ